MVICKPGSPSKLKGRTLEYDENWGEWQNENSRNPTADNLPHLSSRDECHPNPVFPAETLFVAALKGD
jgi:hypothetical protein